MFGGIDPSKIQGMMKKMGISQKHLNVNRVIFEMGEKNIIIDNPSVLKVIMQGQSSYQVSGEEKEEEVKEKVSEEDVKIVSEKTGKSMEESRKALEKSNGDIAEAIISLSNSND